jgi:hypothetical protein
MSVGNGKRDKKDVSRLDNILLMRVSCLPLDR